MPNNIRHLAVHDIRRTEQGLQIVHGNDALAVSPTTQRIVDELDDLYNRRSSKVHGQFSPDAVNYPAAGHFSDYLAEDGSDFSALTRSLMDTLLAKARTVPNAGAGHVFFAHFEQDGRELMLIAIVTEKLGATLTQAFVARDVTHLDLDGFRYAGRIDLTAWQADDGRYLGFLRGKGAVAEYFKEFLGCVSPSDDKKSTRELTAALIGFADDQGLEGDARNDFLVRANSILDRGSREDRRIDFQAFANELTPDDPAPLTEYLGSPALQLGDDFVPDRRLIGPLLRISYRAANWSVDIDRRALTRGEVGFDPENNTLTIRNLPHALVAQLRAETVDNGEA
ncbi:nucleoid-associated protein [Sphingomonas sanguinis]|uniref:nucleoid-associated protein n=1 Tax=Sphingomonas sanguinis TaxID=33051 RepID=UPI0009ECC8D7|nr:nucleoid-associated protein [Sphingomonas sanguinis]